MAVLNLGKVRGDDGFSPEITVAENTLNSYKLHIKTKTSTGAFNEFDTPNLRGATFKSAVVEVFGQEPVHIPFSDLGLDPLHDYMFYAASGLDYPLLRGIIAIRVVDTVRITIYTDTQPYSSPQAGSPFPSDMRIFGDEDLMLDDFNFGEGVDGESFPVNLLCFEN